MKDRNKKGQFIKGHKNWNEGLFGYKTQPASEERKKRMSFLHKGEGNPAWIGDKVSKAGIHFWLRRNFGKMGICEFCKDNKIIKLEWALKTNKKHERKRKNYLRLCKSCHTKYDYDGGIRKGVKHTEESKKKLSLSIKKYWNEKRNNIIG